MPNNDSTIAVRLRQARDAAGLTQEALARQADVTVRTVAGIERGEVQPTVATLRRLAAACGTTISALVGDEPADAPR